VDSGDRVKVDPPTRPKLRYPDEPMPLVRRANDRFKPLVKSVFGVLPEPIREPAAALALGAVGFGLFYLVFLRGVPAPSFRRSRAFRPRSIWRRIVHDPAKFEAQTFYRRILDRDRSPVLRRIAPWTVGLLVYSFFAVWSLYLIDRDLVFWAIQGIDGFTQALFQRSFAHIWFILESLFGWLLLTAVAIALGSTIFHYRRDRL
jgi:hypothetical protein